MVDVEVSGNSVLLQFQGRRGPTNNKISVEEVEELINDLESALETIKEE